ncbi:hypothetical protein QAD02_005351 [Eretmocerus hayati]|uniref:Uncharacterized protein n=1 Tax=Eretmocerus hayati TaxID=131215 RepID=A0ACC2NUW7_9HYME|nr:hypothetical protein QAD02_005351 [Eretmocerus hayati]
MSKKSRNLKFAHVKLKKEKKKITVAIGDVRLKNDAGLIVPYKPTNENDIERRWYYIRSPLNRQNQTKKHFTLGMVLLLGESRADIERKLASKAKRLNIPTGVDFSSASSIITEDEQKPKGCVKKNKHLIKRKTNAERSSSEFLRSKKNRFSNSAENLSINKDDYEGAAIKVEPINPLEIQIQTDKFVESSPGCSWQNVPIRGVSDMVSVRRVNNRGLEYNTNKHTIDPSVESLERFESRNESQAFVSSGKDLGNKELGNRSQDCDALEPVLNNQEVVDESLDRQGKTECHRSEIHNETSESDDGDDRVNDTSYEDEGLTGYSSEDPDSPVGQEQLNKKDELQRTPHRNINQKNMHDQVTPPLPGRQGISAKHPSRSNQAQNGIKANRIVNPRDLPRRTNRPLGFLQLYLDDDGKTPKIHLGLDRTIDYRAWVTTIAEKNDKRLIRKISLHVWDDVELINRYRDSKSYKYDWRGRSPRKPIEMDKRELVEDLFTNVLQERGVTLDQVILKSKKINPTLSKLIQDLRQRQKFADYVKIPRQIQQQPNEVNLG